jgi:hypothetical protein
VVGVVLTFCAVAVVVAGWFVSEDEEGVIAIWPAPRPIKEATISDLNMMRSFQYRFRKNHDVGSQLLSGS